MQSCSSCGFEGYQGNGLCPLCGLMPSPESSPEHGLPETVDANPVTSSDVRNQEDAGGYGIGSALADRFVLETVLGRGGMGTVYRVLDEQDGRRKALKLLHSIVTEGPDGLERSRREVELLSRVRHSAVPAVHAWGTAQGRFYYVTDLVSGRELSSEILRLGAIPPKEAVRFAAEIADALRAVHLAGVIHRDVKPRNVMLDAEGHVHLLDFGIARSAARETKALTGTGMTLGTPEYMSPEQFGSSRVDARSDVYSLGVLLFEMLAGELPFSGDSPLSVAMGHCFEPARDVRSLKPVVPAWLSRIVAKCLEKDRERRFGDMAELAAALRKSWPDQTVRSRHLRTGDLVREADPRVEAYALVLESPAERRGWVEGMALHFEKRHYKLQDLLPPSRAADPWTYRFVPWPEEEILRKVVDYDADSAARKGAGERPLLNSLRRLWTGRP